ncbi:MAG: T9SS type A sorting domain-containing protein [Flavobacteriales bacterium]|nr:T9SS type A sorting domain-containing protein [Flavobacteriales bacterium]
MKTKKLNIYPKTFAMKKMKLLIFALLAVSLSSYSATWKKIHYLGTNPAINEGYNEVIESQNGGYIGISFENLNEAYVTRMDANGDTLWIKTYNSLSYNMSGISIVEDATSSDIIFVAATTSNNNRPLLLRSDQNGNELWRTVLGNTNTSYSITDFIQTADGGFLMTGSQDFDIFYLKTDASGNQSWSKVYDMNLCASEAHSVEELSGGGYISATEVCSETRLFRLDQNGDSLFTSSFAPSGTLVASAYVTATQNGFDWVSFSGNSGTQSEFVDYKELDASGNVLQSSNSVVPFNMNDITSVAKSAGGLILTSGRVGNIVALDSTGIVSFTYNSVSNTDTTYKPYSCYLNTAGDYVVAGQFIVNGPFIPVKLPFIWGVDSLAQLNNTGNPNLPCMNIALSIQSNPVGDSINAYVTHTAAGFFPPYTFQWSDGSTSTQTSNSHTIEYNPNANPLPYCVTVTDAQGCVDSTCYSSNVPCANYSASINLSANGAYVIGTVTGGTPPYTYSIFGTVIHTTNLAVDSIPNPNIPGNFCLQVTDGAGCATTACISTSQPCNGLGISLIPNNADDTVTAYSSNGFSPFTYVWSTGDTTATIAVPSPGQYCVTMTDANGCVDSSCANLGFCTNYSASITISSNGNYAIGTVTGGSAPYTYSLFGTVIFTTNSAVDSMLIPTNVGGNYCIDVTDGLGCSDTACISTPQPCTGLGITLITNSAQDSVFPYIAYGTAPYSFVWSQGDTTESIQVNTMGQYCLIVTDNNGCVDSACKYICPGYDAQLSISADTSYAIAEATNGSSPYSFNWGFGLTTTSVNPIDSIPIPPGINVPANSYCIEITDGSGCSDTSCYNVPNVINPCASFFVNTQYSISSTPVGSIAVVNAYVNAIVSNGPFTYAWSTGVTNTSSVTTDSIVVNGTGPFCVTVTDATGCTSSSCASGPISPDSVWPGDCNADGIVDVTDLMPIGFGFGFTGPVRANASLLWVGQYATDWGAFYSNGANIKHADADGNGLIDSLDATAILLNYNNTHSKTGFNPSTFTTGKIYLGQINDTLLPGDTVSIPLFAGEPFNPVQSLYGMAFSIGLDTTMVKPGSQLKFHNGWHGVKGASYIAIQKELYGSGKIVGGLTRIDHTEVSGHGQIASLEIVLEDNIAGKSNAPIAMNLGVTDAIHMNVNGIMKGLQSYQSSYLLLPNDQTAAIETEELADFNLYPNPNNGQFTIAGSVEIDRVDVISVTGQLVNSIAVNSQNALIDLTGKSGWYFVKIYSEDQQIIKRVMLNK